MNDKNSAKFIGLFFIAAFFFFGGGNAILDSVLRGDPALANAQNNHNTIVIGGILIFLNSLVVLGIGAFSLPILKRYNPTMAYTYFATRIIEATLLIVGMCALMLHTTMGKTYLNTAPNTIANLQIMSKLAIDFNFYAYQFAMTLLSFVSVFFCAFLYKEQLIPRWAAIWGCLGYTLLLMGCILELFGFPYGIILALPGGFFELYLGGYLIVKGFKIK